MPTVRTPRCQLLQFFEDAGREPLVDDVIGEVPDELGSLDGARGVRKVAQSEELLIELGWEGLDPLAEFLRDKLLEDLRQSVAGSIGLVSGGFVNEGDNPDVRESTH